MHCFRVNLSIYAQRDVPVRQIEVLSEFAAANGLQSSVTYNCFIVINILTKGNCLVRFVLQKIVTCPLLVHHFSHKHCALLQIMKAVFLKVNKTISIHCKPEQSEMKNYLNSVT